MSVVRLLVCLVVFLLVGGCDLGMESVDYSKYGDSTSEDRSSKVYVVTVDQTETVAFQAVLPNGRIINDLAVYKAEISSLIEEAALDGYQVRIDFGETVSEQLQQNLGGVDTLSSSVDELRTSDGEVGVSASALSIGFGFNLTFVMGPKYVSGCVQSNAQRIAVHLNRYSDQVFDLHLATYVKNGYRCFGAYESVCKVVNWCTCSPVSYDQIKNAIYQAAIAAGIWAGLATVIAEASAPIAIGALAL